MALTKRNLCPADVKPAGFTSVYNGSVAFAIFHADAKSILSETSGFIAQAGFTHSLTPARNCGFACTYCYVPTMGIYGGLKPEDWRRWGQFTTFKANAPELLAKSLRAVGIETYATLAPLLPCDPEALADMAISVTDRDIICDPFHVRAVKTTGATTREAALRISWHRGYSEWHDPEFQAGILERLRA